MSKIKVSFYEVFEEEEILLRKHLPGEWNCSFTSASIQESGHSKPESDVICIRTQSIIPKLWANKLSGILSRSAGYDHLTKFTEKTGSSAQIGYLFKYSGRAVAEQAAMLWLCLLRKFPSQKRAMKKFSRDGLTGRECAGRTLAVFGVGDIGHHVCKVGAGLGMHVLGVDIVQSHTNIEYASPDRAIAAADIIVCSMNLTGSNREYFSTEVLRQCRDDALFINVARGEFSKSSTLLRLLEDGQLGGVGLDVFYDEPVMGPALRENKTPDHPEFTALQELLKREDVILTPHNAFNTIEAVDRKSSQTAAQLKHFFDTGRFSPEPLPENA